MERRELLRRAMLTPLAAAPAAGQEAARGGEVIRKVEAIAARVPYRDTFVIGSGRVATGGQTGNYVYVRVESSAGRVGWGETIALPTWSYETVESIVSTVEKHLAPIVLDRSPFDQAWFQKEFDNRLMPAISNGFPFAKSAVQIAVLDLAGRIAGLPLHRMLGGRLRDRVELCFGVSIDTPQGMAEAARSLRSIRCLKVKVSGEPEIDAERLHAVAAARPDAALWIDANQAYRPIYLETFLRRIEGIGQVQCLEQPVQSVDWFGMRRVRERTSLPIAVDEGCFSPFDVARLARMDACDLVVLKAAKSGGPLGCLRSAVVAEANGLGLLGSGLTEAGIGFAASVHLYSTLDLLLPAELNGARFLADLMVDGLRIEDGFATVPDGPGLGVQVQEDKIRQHAFRV
jgi:muconate cycloisomerase